MAGGTEVRADTRELVEVLKRMRGETGDLTPVMAIVAEALVAAVNDEFQTAGGGRWAPLAESTLRSRRGSTAQILVDTGRFAGSIRADYGADYAEASSDVSYAVYHVSDEPRSVIPLRNPFDVPDEVLDSATELIVGAIADKLGGR